MSRTPEYVANTYVLVQEHSNLCRLFSWAMTPWLIEYALNLQWTHKCHIVKLVSLAISLSSFQQ